MVNLQYEIRIPQTIYNRATIKKMFTTKFIWTDLTFFWQNEIVLGIGRSHLRFAVHILLNKFQSIFAASSPFHRSNYKLNGLGKVINNSI